MVAIRAHSVQVRLGFDARATNAHTTVIALTSSVGRLWDAFPCCDKLLMLLELERWSPLVLELIGLEDGRLAAPMQNQRTSTSGTIPEHRELCLLSWGLLAEALDPRQAHMVITSVFYELPF